MAIDVITRGRSDVDVTEPITTKQQQSEPRLPTAAEVMSRFPPTVHMDASLFSAWGKLHGKHNRHLVVVDDDLRPLGVLDERDIALEWPPGPLGAHHLPVHKLLRFRSRPRARGGDDIATVAATMHGSRTDAVPVVDEDGRLLGLVTVWHWVELIAGIRAAGQADAGPGHSSAGSGVEGHSSSRAPSTAACRVNRSSGCETLYPVNWATRVRR
jgi:CBS domain-containing protein